MASVVLASLNSARKKGADAAVKSNLLNARAQAEIYYSSNGDSYFSVCDNDNIPSAKSIKTLLQGALKAVGLPITNISSGPGNSTNAVCNNNSASWAAQVPLSSNSYFCVDSTGKAVVSETSVITSINDYSCY